MYSLLSLSRRRRKQLYNLLKTLVFCIIAPPVGRLGRRAAHTLPPGHLLFVMGYCIFLYVSYEPYRLRIYTVCFLQMFSDKRQFAVAYLNGVFPANLTGCVSIRYVFCKCFQTNGNLLEEVIIKQKISLF